MDLNFILFFLPLHVSSKKHYVAFLLFTDNTNQCVYFLLTLQLTGRDGPEASGTFFPFVFVTNHMMNFRSITWIISILTPTICCMIDIAGKVFSNMFFPTKTQIHAEIAAIEC